MFPGSTTSEPGNNIPRFRLFPNLGINSQMTAYDPYIPAFMPNWYCILRDSYGLPKNAQNNKNYWINENWECAHLFEYLTDFHVRPKVLTPYSWDFIEERFLYNWAKEPPFVDNKFPKEYPYRPPVEVIFGLIS